MKKILITGKNSYVGTKFMEWVSQWPDEYRADAISVRGEEWKQLDFSGYDTVLHVAGIAHVKETKENRDLYYKINRDLAYEVATKSKEAGIPHFIFLSSMSIYGLETGVIDKDTVPKPKNSYGKSKYEAEQLIKGLENERFKVAIVRPPMIYGPNCPGNYARLSKLAKITPFFPKIDNKRSMIFVDNLSIILTQIIDTAKSDNYMPDNIKLSSALQIVSLIAKANGKSINSVSIFNNILIKTNLKPFNSLFKDLYYEFDTTNYEEKDLIDLNKSILITELGKHRGEI
ncbi:NAD-dependent epimerase/dehydratase family protein [Chryseomicrobium palamuruense]